VGIFLNGVLPATARPDNASGVKAANRR